MGRARQDTEMAAAFKALADPTRRAILDLLKEGPLKTGDICDHFDLSRFGVMKHLDVLTDANLVLVRRRGRERWNYLNAMPLQLIYDRWLSDYEKHWARSLTGLKRHTETRHKKDTR